MKGNDGYMSERFVNEKLLRGNVRVRVAWLLLEKCCRRYGALRGVTNGGCWLVPGFVSGRVWTASIRLVHEWAIRAISRGDLSL